ncbi:MAG: PA14 domain-containing protein, partial [Planctomycetota bacterium]|jgi:hypothetical protein
VRRGEQTRLRVARLEHGDTSSGRPPTPYLLYCNWFCDARGLYERIKVDAPGDYTFSLSSDDGSRLWLDGELLVDNDGSHAMEEKSASKRLGAGYHALRVEYFEGAGSSGLVLSFSGPGITKRVLPGALLCRRP